MSLPMYRFRFMRIHLFLHRVWGSKDTILFDYRASVCGGLWIKPESDRYCVFEIHDWADC